MVPRRRPTAAQLGGSGQNMFTGGFDNNGSCGLARGSTPTLLQVIPLGPYAGRADNAPWSAQRRPRFLSRVGRRSTAHSWSLGGGNQVLATSATEIVYDYSPTPRIRRGRLPAGATAVRLTLSFPLAAAFSGSFADEVSFRLTG